MDLTVSTSRPANYEDMNYLGKHDVFAYHGNVLVVPAGVAWSSATKDTAAKHAVSVYSLADVAIFIHSDGRTIRNKFGRIFND